MAVVLGDESGQIPRYVDRVRAVFKSYGLRPQPAGRAPRRRSAHRRAGAGAALGPLAALATRRGGAGAHAPGAAPGGRALPPDVALIPVGTYNQLDLPIVPMSDRSTDVFFAGSVEHDATVRARIGSPKARSRREMVAAVESLAARRPGLRTDVRLTSGFTASEAAAAGYSQGLMDSRICLAPRGNSAETFRVLEGLRYGCVVVGERLPRFWFYEGSPVLQLRSWGELERVVAPILDDPGEMARLHAESLAWWRDRCSEQAVGRFLAERLNRL